MAIRRKKGSTAEPPAPAADTRGKKKAATTTTAKKKVAAPRRKQPAVNPELVEELQTVGADVVPTVTIEADVAGTHPPGFVSQHEPVRESIDAPPAAARDQEAGSGKTVTAKAELTSTGRGRRGRASSAKAAEPEAAPEIAPEAPAQAADNSNAVPDSRDSETAADARDRRGRLSSTEPAQPAPVAELALAAPPQPEPRNAQPVPEPRNPEPAPAPAPASPPTPELTEHDFYLFNEGSHHKLWEKLGSHIVERDGVTGTLFAVWAPNAARVSVMGDFNGWNPNAHELALRGVSGIWEGFVPGVAKGAHYKYHIVSQFNGYEVDKADPFAVHQETPPQTASVVWDLDYEWQDGDWMASRAQHNAASAPMSIYEIHLGSWRRVGGDGEWRVPTFREIAETLAAYVKKMNFTHIELLPVMEHPFYGSWGYQTTGFFAPTSRYGTPQDLKYFVDVMHRNGIGVILDWVPSHFPTDEHGLSYFDGTHLFEHADPRKGFQPDWGSLIFNYGRNEVRSFLLSSALYWLGEYHADGLRVDAVASMLYLDYSRKAGEWIPNEFGGRENVESIAFLRRMNEDIYKVHPDVQVIAEESTAWPMVSRPTYVGGLGFGMKWDMGWMHDTLRYFETDPVHRKFHHNDLTFRAMYAFTENFVLPLSHDEVVHMKGSLINKMAGDPWQKFANLRLLFAYMYSQPGKKLLFMGGEFGQFREWNHDTSLDWHLLDQPQHDSLRRFVEDLNKLYRDTPALHELDTSPEGFEWIDCCDTEQSVVSMIRRSKTRPDEMIVAVLNFTPVVRHNYAVGVPAGGHWTEVLNSDATLYGGSGQGNLGGIDAAPIRLHGRKWSVHLTLPPLGAVFLRAPVAEVVELDVAAAARTKDETRTHDDPDESDERDEREDADDESAA
jgi:1,4-alpha-glucan branching enzyme